MAAYCRVYDSRHLQADCQELRSAPELYARQSSMGCLFTLPSYCHYYNRDLCNAVGGVNASATYYTRGHGRHQGASALQGTGNRVSYILYDNVGAIESVVSTCEVCAKPAEPVA